MRFPSTRLRRLRRTPALRALVRETRLEPQDLIQPYFAVPGEGVIDEIAAMPGQARVSVDILVKRAREAHDLGVGGILLFGLPHTKDECGSGAWADDGPVCQAIRAVKAEVPDLPVIADVCLCAYTSHGQCGVVEGSSVRNDPTVELLARTATAYAAAGADVVAPSDMMDGRVAAIRVALDQAGHDEVAVLSYAVKYASAYYGPFREAADSAPAHGDRRSYQMDAGNSREALREARLDLDEGADAVMVKPALPYLDVIARLRTEITVPIAAYQVSGEYSQIRAAAARGWLDEEAVVDESLLAIRRAGADIVISYFATDVARRRKA